ncbi:hypothetical protein U1Q18_005861 [Sarracenia purpurea var. burkii]
MSEPDPIPAGRPGRSRLQPSEAWFAATKLSFAVGRRGIIEESFEVLINNLSRAPNTDVTDRSWRTSLRRRNHHHSRLRRGSDPSSTSPFRSCPSSNSPTLIDQLGVRFPDMDNQAWFSAAKLSFAAGRSGTSNGWALNTIPSHIIKL